jgi:hypothetical protein
MGRRRDAAPVGGLLRGVCREHEGSDERLANLWLAVAGFKRGLLSRRVFADWEVLALAAGQPHRGLPVPRRVAGKGDVDDHILAAVGEQEVAVDIGHPAFGYSTGRDGPVTAQHGNAVGQVDTVNQPGPQLRPSLNHDPREQSVFGRARSLPFADDPFRSP